MRESAIESYLVKRVTQTGGEIRKVKWIGRRGAPDRLVLFPCKAVWVETKAPCEPLKPHQKREHQRLQRVGQDVVKIDSLEDVDELIRRLVWQP